MQPQSLIFERVYNAPIERVWQAITDKEQMRSWYFEVTDFKAEPGFCFQFTVENNGISYTHLCVVTEVNPPFKLCYSWRYEGYAGQSLVCFELFRISETTTKLVLTHSGTDTFPSDRPDFATANFSEGWNYILGTALTAFLEKQV